MMHQFRMRMLMESAFIFGRFYIFIFFKNINSTLFLVETSANFYSTFFIFRKIIQINFSRERERERAMFFFLRELQLRCDCLDINVTQNLSSSEETQNKTLCNGMFDGFFHSVLLSGQLKMHLRCEMCIKKSNNNNNTLN